MSAFKLILHCKYVTTIFGERLGALNCKNHMDGVNVLALYLENSSLIPVTAYSPLNTA